jgi:peptidoglycan/xylan/chitin deacetylase (PgdA/CDA1 family)
MSRVPQRVMTPAALRRRRAKQLAARRRRRAAAIGAMLTALAVVMMVTEFSGAGASRHVATAAARPAPAAPAGGERPPVHATVSLATRERAALHRAARRLPVVSVGGRAHREVALTFDDGPGPYTLRILRVLRRLHAPATFFQVGRMIADFPEAQRALLADRQVVLGDHTMNHPSLPALSAAGQRQEIAGSAAVQVRSGARMPSLFRPPYGTLDHSTEKVVRGLGMLPILWSVDSQDYLRPGAGQIVMRVLRQARPGAIILMHDAGGTRTDTQLALPTVIKALRAKHYRLVTVPQLLLDAPPPTHQPPRTVGVG